MSPLTYWLSIGALIPVALLVINAVAYRRRFGTFLRAERRPYVKQNLSKIQVVLSLLPVLALLVCVAAPVLAPSNPFTHWLLEPYSRAVFVIWSFLISMIVSVILVICAHVIKRAR